MQPFLSLIAPILFTALVVWIIYRRLRRIFGQQPLRPAAMRTRIAILIVVGCLLLPAALRSSVFLSAILGGAFLGAVLAVFGAQRTRFIRTTGQLFYVPHTYTGAVVALLFLGRIAYRLVEAYLQMHAGKLDLDAQNSSPFGLIKSPLTLGLYFVLMGYYVCYYAMVLQKSKGIAADAANA